MACARLICPLNFRWQPVYTGPAVTRVFLDNNRLTVDSVPAVCALLEREAGPKAVVGGRPDGHLRAGLDGGAADQAREARFSTVYGGHSRPTLCSSVEKCAFVGALWSCRPDSRWHPLPLRPLEFLEMPEDLCHKDWSLMVIVNRHMLNVYYCSSVPSIDGI